MKKRIAFLLTTGVLFAGGIFFWTADMSSAQEKVDSNSSTIVQKIDELVSQFLF